jgi:aminoglycoside phosphotransferase (APT) family kinase protein
VTQTTFDSGDKAAIAASLEAFLRERFGDVHIAGGLQVLAGGLDTYVYGLSIRGAPPPGWPSRVVLRVYPGLQQVAKMEREFAVQEFVTARGFPAAKPLLAGPPDVLGLPFMLMERIEGVQAVEAFKNPLRIRGVLRQMAALQARLHVLPIDGCPLPYDSPLIDHLLAQPRELLARYPEPDAMRGLRWLEDTASLVRDEQPVLVHNDFHPVNILADGRKLTLLDWSDAALGDRHSDVARTLAVFWHAPYFQAGIARRALLFLRRPIISWYLRDYQSHAPLRRDRLRYWEAAHAFSEWVTIVVADRHGDAAIGAREGVAGSLPRGIADILWQYFAERAAPALV